MLLLLCLQGSAAACADVSLTAAEIAASLNRWEFAAAESAAALQRVQQQQQQLQQQDFDGGASTAAAAAAELRATVALTEALSRINLQKAEVYVQRLMLQLPNELTLIDSEDVESWTLPSSGRSRRKKNDSTPAGAAAAAAGPGAAGGDAPAAAATAAAKKKRKKKRLPKGCSEDKSKMHAPDPERWRPKHER